MIDEQAIRTEDTASVTPRRSATRKRNVLRRAIVAMLAFSLGFGSGYLVWGRRQPAATGAQPADSAGAKPSVEIDLAALSRQVNPPEGFSVPATFGDLGPRLLAAGAIDLERFKQVYEQAGQPLTEAQLAILTQGSGESIVINGENADFLLNFFWAAGLTNQNRILTEGQMMQGGPAQIGNFASTAGWTIGRKSPTELYASTPLIALTTEQQIRLEEVAANVYRPCCDNPTHFPDCNHGMAMLGLLELMASQGATTDDMLATAKYANAFWYPQQTLEQAVFFKAARGLNFDQVEPREIVGARYSSASGFQAVHKLLADNGMLKPSAGGGGSCGVQP